MPIFLERFVLPALATALIAVVIINPLKFDWQQRLGLLVAVLGLAYFVARTVYVNNRSALTVQPPATPILDTPGPVKAAPPATTGPATTHGDNSPATSGSIGKFNYNPPPHTKKKKPSEGK